MPEDKKKADETSNFRNATTKAIADLRLKNKRLNDNAIANKKKKARSAKQKAVSDKYTKIAGLQGLQGLQRLSPKKKNKK